MGRVEYTISRGRADADRLARLATVMDEATLAFLTGIGARPGAACLEVGCRTGQVSIELARVVGPTGRVVAIDVDAEALEIAEQAAADAGVDVTFLEADGTSPIEADAFDLAFAQLVLSHLADPMPVLRSMRSAVRPGGVVAAEDIFTPSLHAEPPVAALEKLVEVYSATERFHGGDPAIGPRLPALLEAAGLDDVREQTVVNRMTTAHEKLFLAQLLDNMRDAIVSARAATVDEITELSAAVTAGAQDPDTVFLQARMHQVSGRRT